MFKGTIYEQYPFLLCTPFAWWDIGLAYMLGAHIDTWFDVAQSLSAKVKPMGDFHPEGTKG